MRVQSRPRPSADDVAPDSMGEPGGFGFRLLVSPSAGRIRHLPPNSFRDGHEWVARDQPLVMVEQGSVAIEVRSPIDAKLSGMLVGDGEPVHPGQPLVWLEEIPKRRET